MESSVFAHTQTHRIHHCKKYWKKCIQEKSILDGNMDPHQKMKAAKMVTVSIYARIFSYYLQSFKRELTIQTKINNVMQGYKKYESKMCNNNSIKIRRDKVKISLFRQHDFICRKSNEIYLKKKGY